MKKLNEKNFIQKLLSRRKTKLADYYRGILIKIYSRIKKPSICLGLVTITVLSITVMVFSFLKTTSAADSSALVSFVKIDSTTKGNWKGKYGSGGYQIAMGATNLPNFVSVSFINNEDYNDYIWATSTDDTRALEKVDSATDRFASTWYNNIFNLAVNQTDSLTHQVALYVLDWDNSSRVQTIQVIDSQTSKILDTQNVSNFSDGKYFVWNIKGNVVFLVASTGGNGKNAVVSGIFFDPQGGSVPAPELPDTGNIRAPTNLIIPAGIVVAILFLFYFLSGRKKMEIKSN